MIDEQGLPQPCGTPATNILTKEEQLQNLIEEAFDDTNISSKETLLRFIAQRTGLSNKTAIRRIDSAVEAGLIEVLPNKMYQLKGE